jgi:hypothetical protein
MATTRRLAAILAADVAGYSRLMAGVEAAVVLSESLRWTADRKRPNPDACVFEHHD